MRSLRALGFFLACQLFNTALYAENYDALIAQIKAQNPDSEISTLGNDKSTAYFAISTQAPLAPSKGTVVLIHDQGEHADWPDVIRPLRLLLIRSGWNTLSIQFPTIAGKPGSQTRTETLDQRYISDLQALIATQNSDKLILMVHGDNNLLLTNALTAPLANLAAYVAISATEPQDKEANPLLTNLLKLNVPLLDLYAQRDFPWVISAANRRLQRIKKQMQTNLGQQATTTSSSNIKYQQLIIPVADHWFIGQEEVLAKRVAGWLSNNAQFVKQGTVTK